MPYNIKYKLETCSLNGNSVALELYKREAVAAPGTLEPVAINGGPDPIVISPKDTDNILEPINGSDGSFQLVSGNGFDAFELNTQDEKEWLVRAYFKGQLYWSGFMLPEGVTQPYSFENYDIQIKATDGLVSLKDTPYFSFIKGRETYIKTIANILLATELYLPIVVGLNTREAQMANVGSPLTLADISNERFKDNSGNPFSNETVLKSILQTFGCKIVQANGRWVIYNVEELAAGPITGIEFNPAGDPIGTMIIGTNIVIGGPSDQGAVLNNSHQITLAKALGKQTAYYQYGYKSNALINGSFDEVVGGNFPGWSPRNGIAWSIVDETETDAAGNVIVVGHALAITNDGANGLYEGDPIQIKANEKVNITLDFITYGIIGQANFELQLVVRDGVVPSYFTANGWQVQGNTYRIDYNNGELTGERLINVSFDVDPKPHDWTLYLGLIGVYKTSSGIAFRETHFNNVAINITSSQALAPYIGQYTTINQTKPITYSEDAVVILNGDDENDLRTSQIRIGNNHTGNWGRANGEAKIYPLLYLIADSILRLNQRPKKLADFEVGTSETVSPISTFTIQQEAGRFLFLAGEFSLVKEEYHLRMVEALTDPVDVEIIQNGLDNGSQKNSSGSSIGQPPSVVTPPTSVPDLSGYVKKWEIWQDHLQVTKSIKAKSYILPTALDPLPLEVGWQIYVDEVGAGEGGTPPETITSLAELTDVYLSNPLLEGQALVYNATLNRWVNGAASGGPVDAYTKAESDARYKAIGYVPTWSEITGKPTNFIFNDGGTYNINISGNANSSTYWGGSAADFNTFGSGDPGYLTGYDASGLIKPFQSGPIKSFLGLTANGNYHKYTDDFGVNADTMDYNSTNFTYSSNAPYTGAIAYFGRTYGFQFNTNYYLGGNADNYRFAFRTLNGDSGTWNGWRSFLINGSNEAANFNGYVQTNARLRASGGSGTEYGTSDLEVFRAGSAPVIGLHWSGTVASTISIEVSDRIAIRNNPGTSYEALIAQDIYANAAFRVTDTYLADGILNLAVGDGNGIGFWQSGKAGDYSMYMGNSGTYGQLTSDGSNSYNMYFRMTGANFGFQFRTGNNTISTEIKNEGVITKGLKALNELLIPAIHLYNRLLVLIDH